LLQKMQQMHPGVEIDMDALPVPLTRDRLLGLQHELHDALADDDFQGRLFECERVHGKGTVEFRRQHQQLVLEVQSTILPKYGFESSLQGVADMLAAVKAFLGDPEVAANIKAIDTLIWKPHESHHGVAVDHEHHSQAALEPHHLDWLERWEQHHQAPQSDEADAFDVRHVPVELDMDAISVPLSKERLLGMQEELRERLATEEFQAQLRKCERTHNEGTPEFRKEHQQLVLEVQAQVLPKYGFKGSLEGVHDMLDAIKAFSKDSEVAANLKAINGLIWRSGVAPDAAAMPQKREV